MLEGIVEPRLAPVADVDDDASYDVLKVKSTFMQSQPLEYTQLMTSPPMPQDGGSFVGGSGAGGMQNQGLVTSMGQVNGNGQDGQEVENLLQSVYDDLGEFGQGFYDPTGFIPDSTSKETGQSLFQIHTSLL